MPKDKISTSHTHSGGGEGSAMDNFTLNHKVNPAADVTRGKRVEER